MKRGDVFPSKYLKASDLNGKPVVVTIERATFEKLKTPDGKEQEKIVLAFVKAKKTLPLNLTNYDAVTGIVGDDETDNWPGHQIELFADKTHMAGKIVSCVRIRPPGQRDLPLAKPSDRGPTGSPSAAQRPLADEMDDDIPF
jgi:hypothetical protein